MGGSREQISANVVKVLDTLKQAKAEVESIEELAQVSHQCVPFDIDEELTSLAAFKTYACQSERPMEEISKAYHQSR